MLVLQLSDSRRQACPHRTREAGGGDGLPARHRDALPVFVDDTFNVPLPRFKKLLRMMIDKAWGFEWISFFRCSNADEEAFDLMARSGCIGVFLGIESGDQTILEYMDKHAKVE